MRGATPARLPRSPVPPRPSRGAARRRNCRARRVCAAPSGRWRSSRGARIRTTGNCSPPPPSTGAARSSAPTTRSVASAWDGGDGGGGAVLRFAAMSDPERQAALDDVILVDEQDRPVGTAPKLAAHQDGGTLHRAFSVFIFDSAGRMLLQRRA